MSEGSAATGCVRDFPTGSWCPLVLGGTFQKSPVGLGGVRFGVHVGDASLGARSVSRVGVTCRCGGGGGSAFGTVETSRTLVLESPADSPRSHRFPFLVVDARTIYFPPRPVLGSRTRPCVKLFRGPRTPGMFSASVRDVSSRNIRRVQRVSSPPTSRTGGHLMFPIFPQSRGKSFGLRTRRNMTVPLASRSLAVHPVSRGRIRWWGHRYMRRCPSIHTAT